MLIPKSEDRFRPRADAALLSRLVTDAWQNYQNRMFDTAERDRVAEIVAAHLELLYPADDMAVLSRYGVAQTLKSISVRMWNPDQHLWDQTTSVDLPRPILAPSSEHGLYVGGAWHSRLPNYGCTQAYRDAQTPEQWAELVDYHDDSERRRIPEIVEPWFARIVEARKAHRAEYAQTTEFPSKFHAETGRYPRWRDIETAHPILGAYIATQRAAVPDLVS
jgi:hypothetical protein